MADNDNVLFVRGNNQKDTENDDENVWDDTLLIKAYDKAINLAKEEVAKRLSMETDSFQVRSNKSQQHSKQSKHGNHHSKKWTVGSPCRAVYSVDGETYEAIISKMFGDSRTCLVKFVGYGNTERVELSSLKESDGLQSQIAQKKDADVLTNSYNSGEDLQFPQQAVSHEDSAGETMDYESEAPKRQRHISNSGSSYNPPRMFETMPPAPPLPPHLMAKLPANDADALSSMLMSWYISGFHTGYYHGIKQAQNDGDRRKKC